MDLKNLLSDKRSKIIRKWRDEIIGTYPDEAQRFFKKEKDPFSNPVGQIIGKDIEDLYDALIKDADMGRMATCLENIIRIRAVQDFKPSQAIGFLLHLKRIIGEELGGEYAHNGLSGELHLLYRKIDAIALLAFDIYSQCRQKLYELRVNEVRNQVGALLRRANLTCEIPEKGPDL